MSEPVEDTEILLALLSSLLKAPVTDQNTLLDALVKSDGDVERAAKLLNACSSPEPQPKVAGLKRKRKGGLRDWLATDDKRDTSKSRRTREVTPDASNDNEPSSSKPTSERPSSISPRKVKPVTQQEFMTILRPPNSSDAKAQGPPKFPPLTLTTPAMVAKHTPCTMHLSVLPPELACR